MAEHPLIENVNHTSDRLLTPDETLPRIIGDTDEQLLSSKVYERQVKETIRGLNRSRMKFNRKGKVRLNMMVDDELQEVELDIRAIPDQVLEQIQAEFQELYITIPERWEKEAVWDADQQVWVPGYVQNHDDPEYAVVARKLTRLMRRMNYEKAVHGLADPFLDGSTVIWHSAQAYKYSIDDAIQYLHDMGITYDQVQQIVAEVDKLSTQSAITNTEELKKKQEQA